MGGGLRREFKRGYLIQPLKGVFLQIGGVGKKFELEFGSYFEIIVTCLELSF
jgi:hypothetical protein